MNARRMSARRMSARRMSARRGSETCLAESSLRGRIQASIVRRFEFRGRQVADRLQQPTIVEPVDPFEHRILDRLEVAPGPPQSDDLGLEEADTVSASALSYESPTLPTERSMPAWASRSV